VTKRTRMAPADRRAEVIAAAVRMAAFYGLAKVTRDQIATAAGVSPGLVSQYWGTMQQLRRAIVGEAIRGEHLVVLAQALAAGDKRAQGAPEYLRRAAADSLL
jgi:AcrR family transcriptional regulator